MEDTSKKESPYIGCNRFGGKRNAHACAHFDRYRGCRRRCKSLEEVLASTETFTDDVKSIYEGRQSLLPAKHSLKGLPLEPFRCPLCDYVAKSLRGLKAHKTRSHS